MTLRTELVCILGFLAAACGGAQSAADGPLPPPPERPRPTAEATAPAALQPAASTTPAPAPKAEAPSEGPAPVVHYTGGLATPESVLYDEAQDRYLVSNINGSPFDIDDNGYIAVLSPEGQVTNAKWIASGTNKVKLNAPKGLAIADGVLYVADVTVVRKFDAKTGAPKGEIAVPGATFLNDVSAGPDGKIYVSDSGLKRDEKGDFAPSGTDAVYVIEKGKPRALAKSKDLGSPNGLLATDKGVIVVGFGNNELYRLDNEGKRKDVTVLPEAGLDGVVAAGDALFVSSWKGEAVYRGKIGEKFEKVVSGVKGAADIGFDKKRGRLLVPRFFDHAVDAYEVK